MVGLIDVLGMYTLGAVVSEVSTAGLNGTISPLEWNPECRS